MLLRKQNVTGRAVGADAAAGLPVALFGCQGRVVFRFTFVYAIFMIVSVRSFGSPFFFISPVATTSQGSKVACRLSTNDERQEERELRHVAGNAEHEPPPKKE